MAPLAHPIDISIFVLFLAITLFVGLKYGRSVKTLREYALGGRNFSTPTLAATIVATLVTGSFLTFRPEQIYSNGLFFILLYLSADFGTLFVTGVVFAKRMKPFLGSTSIAATMGDLYGKQVRTITAIFGTLLSIGFVALQFKAGAKIFSLILGTESTHTAIIAASVVIIYSAFGGIRAVTFTDILQFFTFGTLIPILALMIWEQVSGFDAVMHMLATTPQFSPKELLGSSGNGIGLLTLLPLCFIPVFSPPIFQRAAMAKNVAQVRSSFLHAALICLVLTLFIVWITILVRTNNPDMAPGNILRHIIEKYSSVGFTGILFAGTMATVMSTADSNLNAAAILIVNDIIAPLRADGSKKLTKEEDKKQLILARIASLTIGMLALVMALVPASYVALVRLILGFYMSVVTVPLLLAMFGFRSGAKPALLGMGLGFMTVLLWRIFLEDVGIDATIPGIMANLAGILGSHYLLGEKGGFKKTILNAIELDIDDDW